MTSPKNNSSYPIGMKFFPHHNYIPRWSYDAHGYENKISLQKKSIIFFFRYDKYGTDYDNKSSIVVH